MPRKCTQEKLSIEPILQDFSVSSLTDTNSDILPPSDSTLLVTDAHYEVDVANVSLSQTMACASYPADSTIMENIQNTSPVFKKPFNVKHIQKPRHSLFDLDLKDSEPDTPEQIAHRPFQRKKKGGHKANILADKSFNKDLNLSNENLKSSNCSQNLTKFRKTKALEKSLFDQDFTSESDNSFSTAPAFQRQKTNHRSKIPAVFDDVFEQSSDSSVNHTLPNTCRTSANLLVENQENLDNTLDSSLRKCQDKIVKPHHVLPRNRNFITRRKTKQKKLMKSDIFDKDLLTSESDESFSLKPGFKKHSVVQEIKDTTIFDNTMELSGDHNLSTTKSPILKNLPFKTSKRIYAKDASLFDSLLNESLNKPENTLAISHDVLSKQFFKDRVNDSINFDDLINDTCDASSLMSNSLMIKDKSHEKEEKPLSDDKTHASIDFPQLTLQSNPGLDISNKSKESNISCSMKLSKVSDISHDVLSKQFFKDQVDDSIKFDDVVNDTCDASSLMSNSLMLKDKSLEKEEKTLSDDKTCASIDFPQLTLQSSPGLDISNKSKESNNSSSMKLSKVSEINSSSKIVMLSVGNAEVFCSELNIQESHENLQESHENLQECSLKSTLEFSSEFSVDKIEKKDSNSIIENIDNSTQVSCEKDERSKSLTSLCKIKKQQGKRVSFKIQNDGEVKKTDRNSVLNNTCLEEKSYTKCNESQNLNNSCSLESLVFDGSSSEITSGSVFIDLCASRNKSSSVNMNLESNGCQADIINKKRVIEVNYDEIESTEKDKEMGVDSLEEQTMKNKQETGLEDEREMFEIEEPDDDDEMSKTHVDEEVEEEENNAKDIREHNFESSEDRSGEFDESSKITDGALPESMREEISNHHTHCETGAVLEGNENSHLCLGNKELKHSDNLPVNIHNYQFKKPGYCTVFNENIPTPPNKRKIKEILAKMPLSEFKSKKPKPVSAALTKEQIEQDKIEEMLRKRQKKTTLRTVKTVKLTKPKYMFPKVYDFIIEKLEKRFGIKSRLQAERVVITLNEQVDMIMRKENKLVETVQEMKVNLANLQIIRTHWDFYKFIMNYFEGYFTQKVYPSGVVSPFEPEDPFQNVINTSTE